MGKKQSETEVPTPEWLKGIGSETLERWLEFWNWIQGSGSLGDKSMEIIERGWLPLILGEIKKVH